MSEYVCPAEAGESEEIMLITSAEANKLLHKLNDEHRMILALERDAREFVAATCEDIDNARPDYDYETTQAMLREQEEKITALKHAINVFNVTQEVPGFGITIDRMLVKIPQLSQKKEKLREMRAALPKTRNRTSGSSSLIEYTYANYDIAKVAADYDAVTDELTRAQNALDLVNSTVKFEIEI